MRSKSRTLPSRTSCSSSNAFKSSDTLLVLMVPFCLPSEKTIIAKYPKLLITRDKKSFTDLKPFRPTTLAAMIYFPYKIGYADFYCALRTFKEQLVLKWKRIVELLLFSCCFTYLLLSTDFRTGYSCIKTGSNLQG